MSEKNDGGPAFPVWRPEGPKMQDGYPEYHADMIPGMPLRDYFAAAALTGIMANPERWKQIADDYTAGKKTYEQCSQSNAVKAYSLADAMLAARDKS